MSAHEDGQADETARGGTLRRLPDPPSLIRAREAAVRRANDEPGPPPAGGATDGHRAAVDDDPRALDQERTPASADGGPVGEARVRAGVDPKAVGENHGSAGEGRDGAGVGRMATGETLRVADDDRVAGGGRAVVDDGRGVAREEAVPAGPSDRTEANRLSDFEPGLVASRPPGGAPTRSRKAPSPEPEPEPEPQPGRQSVDTDEPTAVLPVIPDGAPAVGPAEDAGSGPADATQSPGGAHGQASPGASGTPSPAADEPTAVLPVFADGAGPGVTPGPASAAASTSAPYGGPAQAPPSAPGRPAAPPGSPAPAGPPGPPGSVADSEPTAPPAAVSEAAAATQGPPAPGPQTAPAPYSGGPYAPPHDHLPHDHLPHDRPPHGHPHPAPYQQQRQPHPAGQQPAHPQPAHPQAAAPYRAVPARVSVPVVGPELAGTEGKVRHGDTFARRTGRYLKRLLPSSSDTAAVAVAVQSIQQPLASGRQIAVTSIRGGSGKSTVAALLALTFAHHRTDPVIAVEADPALGTLPRRLGATEVRWSCADLARILDPSMQITDLIGYLLPFPGGGWLLPGSQGTVGTQLDLDTYRIVMTSMRRYFAATVVDCQTLPAEVARTALTTTQARVLVAPATVEGVAATRTVLEWLGKLHRSMLPTTVVALTHTTPDSTLDVRRSTELLQQGGAHVVTLPYDRHLAGGGAIAKDLLALETQEAATRLGGAVMDRAASH